MTRAIIFDCFGVLAEDGWLPFKRKYIGDNQKLAQEVADLGKQNDYGMIGINDYFKIASAKIGVDEQLLREAVGRQVPNTELFDYIRKSLKPKYKIGLLSNANYDVVSQLFTPDQAGLIDASALSYEARLVKPDHRMFELIASRLGVELDECVLVDDLERYCTEAEALGMKSIIYRDLESFQKDISKIL